MDSGGYRGTTPTDRYGRPLPKAAHVTVRLEVQRECGRTEALRCGEVTIRPTKTE